MLVALLLANVLAHPGYALPTSIYSPSSLDLSQCNSEPSPDMGRTVSGIFWSCTTTIFACTWVAVHPNVPAEHDSEWVIFRRRAWILAVALVAPEFIILWAANQLRTARRSVIMLRHHRACAHWTLTHGLFLIMGGFMLVDGSVKRLGVLQEKNLDILLSNGDIRLPSLPSSEIKDRSKGDALAKLLVLVQTTWFISQVVSRAVQHLPITELELTTVAFASLNFLTYVLWWKKPLDVRHPILVPLQTSISNTEVDDSDAYPTEVDITDPDRDRLDESTDDSETLRLSFILPANRSASSELDPDIRIGEPEDQPKSEYERPARALKRPTSPWVSTSTRPHLLSRTITQVRDSLTHLELLVRRFMRPWSTEWHFASFGARPIPPEVQVAFETRVPTFYGGTATLHSSPLGPRLPITLELLIGALFGGIHCAGWAFYFPSDAERSLWKQTSLCITLAPLFLWGFALTKQGILHLQSTYIRRLGAMEAGYRTSGVGIWFLSKLIKSSYILRYVVPAIFFVYIVARLATFVLALELLRALPAGALKEVQWSKFIPHV